MSTCELCGTSVNYSLLSVKIAGGLVSVCKGCKEMGTAVDSIPTNLSHTFRRRKNEVLTKEEVVKNFNSVVNSSLAKKGLNIQQLARMLNIKESTLNKMLTGKIQPDIQTAKRLENFFEIKLVEIVDVDNEDFSDSIVSESDTTAVTLGDLLKKAKEKNK